MDTDYGLQLSDNNLDIKQFYNLGCELGQGTYGIVKVSERNCLASNMLIMKNGTETRQDTQFKFAIK